MKRPHRGRCGIEHRYMDPLFPMCVSKSGIVLQRGEMMEELKPQLDELRKSVDTKATENRDVRDGWNGKTREFLTTRNSFNAQVRELISEVQRQKSIRDEANASVRDAKSVRSEKNQSVKDAKQAVQQITGESDQVPESRSGGRDWRKREKKETPMMLKKPLRRLEGEFERGIHTGKNEKKVMEKMKRIQQKIRGMEHAESSNTELKGARDALTAAINEQEIAHQAVTEAAESAQEAHDLMIKLSEEVDRLREKADSAQAKVRRAKREADGAHQSYIVSLRCLHSIQDILRAKRNRETGKETKSSGQTARVGVADLMERLMDGDELSVEDLMALQRGG